MTIITPSILWEATDLELKELLREVQKELILRNSNRTVTEPWLTNLVELDIPTEKTPEYIPPFADLEAEAELMKDFVY